MVKLEKEKKGKRKRSERAERRKEERGEGRKRGEERDWCIRERGKNERKGGSSRIVPALRPGF